MSESNQSNKVSQLASDALQVLPIMSEIYQLVMSLKDKEVTDDDKEKLYRLTRELRSKAAEVSLLPTIEDELKGVDIDDVRDRMIRISERLLFKCPVQVLEDEDQ